MVNTSPQGVMWICTLNNPDPTFLSEYLEKWHTIGKALFVTGQLERGAEGTPHLQYFLHFGQKCRISALKKHCTKSHFTLVRKDNGAPEYCNKEETRIEGPWTFGIKPARKDKKGDCARRNKDILEMGAEKAVEEGHCAIENYPKLAQALNLFRLTKCTAAAPGKLRGIWIWGPPGTGKSLYATTKWPDAFRKA